MAVEPLSELKSPAEFSVRASNGTLNQCVASALDTVNEMREIATGCWDLLGLQEAVEFASAVEEISRITDYLKLTAAAAIDQHHPAHALAATPVAATAATSLHVVDGSDDACGPATTESSRSTASAGYDACPQDERLASPKSGGRLREFRSTADFMRARLRISRAEARRRLALATAVLPTTALTGEILPPAYPSVAQACAEGMLAEADVDVIARALEEALPRLEPQALEGMEKQLTDIGSRQDHDFLVRTAKHWIALLDQDRPPTEEELKQFQGIFPGRRRNGLNHLHIYCTDEQHEALTTLINSAANPRVNGTDDAKPAGATCSPTGSCVTDDAGAAGAACSPTRSGVTGSGVTDAAGAVGAAGKPESGGMTEPGGAPTEQQLPEAGMFKPSAVAQDPPGQPLVIDRLPRPTRPQQLLEGLLAAVRAALASGGLPAAGGLRPQVMITINHDSLLKGLTGPIIGRDAKNWNRRDAKNDLDSRDRDDAPNNRNTENDNNAFPSPGSAAFSGPIDTRAVRRLACDADLIPVVLGSKGQVLDLGRAARLFPPHLRKALHARDGGCTFPGCTVPGPWTEAHHVTFWERGGGTGIENGMLLCSFHHHLIHQGNWEVSIRAGIPWFLPPRYVDPDRRALRNAYFHPEFLVPAISDPA